MRLYLRDFFGFNPKAVWRNLFLNIAAAATEGIGLMMLLPLLNLAGVGFGEQNFFWGFNIRLDLMTALCIFVGLIVLQSGLTLLKDRQSHALQQNYVSHLRKMLYAAIADSSWRFLSQRHGSEFLCTLTHEIQRIGGGTHFVLQLFTLSVLFPAYILVSLSLSVSLSLFALAIGLVLWGVLGQTNQAAKQSGALLSGANRGMFEQIQEFLNSLKLVKIHGEEAADVRQFNAAVDKITGRFNEFNRAQTQVRMIYRIGGAFALALLTYVALSVFKLPVAYLLVMIAIFSRLLPMLSSLQTCIQQISHMLPAYESMRRLLDECMANQKQNVLSQSFAFKKGILIDSLNFKHANAHHQLRVNRLFLPAGKTTAIIGPSGAGKTTLLDLICGLQKPDEGDIWVDDAHFSGGFGKSIAYVPQETLIFDGSVYENLTWANGDIRDEVIQNALDCSALSGLVKKLPNGLETQVGERGVKLSGGEKQRLGLARALLRDPKLLVLDEATSALDLENQQLIFEAIRNLHGKMTVLIVAHRLEGLKGLLDGMVRIDDGLVSDWEPV